MKKIGGEFEINPKLFRKMKDMAASGEEPIYASGRMALGRIFDHFLDQNQDGLTIHLPFYICQSVVETCKHMGVAFKFYTLENSFRFDLAQLDSVGKGEMLLLVNYFGFIEDSEMVAAIKKVRPDIICISDYVMSLWNFEQSAADFTITSFRKHIPLPDGALLRSKEILINKPFPVNRFYKAKLLASILKFEKTYDESYLSLFAEGEEILDNEQGITLASPLTGKLHAMYDLEKMKEQRVENYRYVYEHGQKHNLQFVFPYNENVVPMCVPVVVEDKPKLKAELMKEGIFLPTHWPVFAENKGDKLADFMWNNTVSLVIDHRYSQKDMKRMIKLIKH